MKIRLLFAFLFVSSILPGRSDSLFVTTSDSCISFTVPVNDTALIIGVYSNQNGSHYRIIQSENESRIIYFPNQIKGIHQINIVYSEKNRLISDQHVVIVRNKTWWLWMMFSILGGLGLFLFGINYMSDGFLRLMEHRIHHLVQYFSSNVLKSVLSGITLTTIMQSSSAASIFLMRLVENRLIKLRQTVGLIVGGALGTTVTLQIIALQINSYALLLIGIGFIFSFIIKNNKFKRIGQIITGLGFLYLGLLTMTDGASQLKTITSVLIFLSQMSNPFAGIITGIVLTALTQSASAFIGILIMLGSLHLISLEASIALFIGSNIGTSLPVFLAALKHSSEAKKIAWFHLYYRLLVASFFIFWIPEFSQLITKMSVFINQGNPVSLPHLIANAHTFMYVALTLLLSPFIPTLYKYFSRFVKKTTDNDPFQPKYINEKSLSSPGIALILAKKETLHMANLVCNMVEELLPAFLEKDKKRIHHLEQSERVVNVLRDSITQFLIKLNKQNQNIETAKEIYKLLGIVKELEEIADIVDTNLIPKAKFWSNSAYIFSEEGKKELIEFHHHCLKHLQAVIQAMASYNERYARRLKNIEKETIRMAYELEKSHFSRLIEEVEASVQSSKVHIELIGLMHAITRHATQIVRILYDFD